MNKEFYKGRHLFYLGLIIFIWSVFVLRLFYIQVIDNRYILASDNISIRNMIIIPARGLVYDRNQKLLVNNEPVFDIMVIAEQVFDI
ncbi:MAG: penicillin-binding protein 2, partial [Bacteroidales bacterium]|nr:penicillin-binding protein 2 [Bacteroidales bacterium]